MIGAGSPRNCGLISGIGKRFISSLNFLDPPCDSHSLVLSRLWGLFSQQLNGQCVNLTIHIYLVPSLRMGEAVLPVLRMPKLGTHGL